ncbi:replication initiation protein (plasmid) [Escherichia coli]|nr:replication initiation protein [Escherichia coli]
MHEPPFSLTAAFFPVNYHLESNPEKRVKTPMAAQVTDSQNKEALRC